VRSMRSSDAPTAQLPQELSVFIEFFRFIFEPVNSDIIFSISPTI
jgi:hypothetical protein